VNALLEVGLKSLTLTSGTISSAEALREVRVIGAESVGAIPEVRLDRKSVVSVSGSVPERAAQLVREAAGEAHNRIIPIVAREASLDKVTQLVDRAAEDVNFRLVVITPKGEYYIVRNGVRVPLCDVKANPEAELSRLLTNSANTIVLVSHGYVRSTSLFGSGGTDIVSLGDKGSLSVAAEQSQMRLRTATVDSNGRPDYTMADKVSRRIELTDGATAETLENNQLQMNKQRNYTDLIDNAMRLQEDALLRLRQLAPEAARIINETLKERRGADRDYTNTNLRGDVGSASAAVDRTIDRSARWIREQAREGGMLDRIILSQNGEAREFMAELRGEDLARGSVPLGRARTPAELNSARAQYTTADLPIYAPRYIEPGMVDARSTTDARQELAKQFYESITSQDIARSRALLPASIDWLKQNGYADPGTGDLYLDSEFLPILNQLTDSTQVYRKAINVGLASTNSSAQGVSLPEQGPVFGQQAFEVLQSVTNNMLPTASLGESLSVVAALGQAIKPFTDIATASGDSLPLVPVTELREAQKKGDVLAVTDLVLGLVKEKYPDKADALTKLIKPLREPYARMQRAKNAIERKEAAKAINKAFPSRSDIEEIAQNNFPGLSPMTLVPLLGLTTPEQNSTLTAIYWALTPDAEGPGLLPLKISDKITLQEMLYVAQGEISLADLVAGRAGKQPIGEAAKLLSRLQRVSMATRGLNRIEGLGNWIPGQTQAVPEAVTDPKTREALEKLDKEVRDLQKSGFDWKTAL